MLSASRKAKFGKNYGSRDVMAMDDQWGAFFSEIVRLTAAREAGCTENVVEATLLKLENYVHILNAIIAAISSKR